MNATLVYMYSTSTYVMIGFDNRNEVTKVTEVTDKTQTTCPESDWSQ